MLVFVTGLWFESTCNKRRHSQQNQTKTTPPRHAIFSVHHRHCRFSSTAPSPKPLWLLRRYLQLQKKKKKKKIRVTPHSDYLTIFFFFSILNIYIDIGMRDWRRRMLKCFEDLESSISGVKLLGSFFLFLIYWSCCFTQYNRLLVGALLGLRPFLLLNECFYLLQTNVSI